MFSLVVAGELGGFVILYELLVGASRSAQAAHRGADQQSGRSCTPYALYFGAQLAKLTFNMNTSNVNLKWMKNVVKIIWNHTALVNNQLVKRVVNFLVDKPLTLY